MKDEFQNSREAPEGQPGSSDSPGMKKDSADVREGARQVDQLDRLHPGDDPDRKSDNQRIGSPPVSHVDNGSPADHDYPRNEQTWPENKEPTK
jgi:hypothetical protein